MELRPERKDRGRRKKEKTSVPGGVELGHLEESSKAGAIYKNSTKMPTKPNTDTWMPDVNMKRPLEILIKEYDGDWSQGKNVRLKFPIKSWMGIEQVEPESRETFRKLWLWKNKRNTVLVLEAQCWRIVCVLKLGGSPSSGTSFISFPFPSRGYIWSQLAFSELVFSDQVTPEDQERSQEVFPRNMINCVLC